MDAPGTSLRPSASAGLRGSTRTETLLALALSLGSAALYAATSHPDWLPDTLRYANLTQSGNASVLLRPEHALGNLVPLIGYRVARGAGYAGSSAPILQGFSAAATAVAVGAVFLTARRLGATRRASVVLAAGLALTSTFWRAGGSGGAYGFALATTAVAWLALASLALASAGRSHSGRRVLIAGVASGMAVAAHLANLAVVMAGAWVVAATVHRDGADGIRRRLSPAVSFLLGATLGAGSILVPVVGLSHGLSVRGVVDWARSAGIGRPTDRSAHVGWGTHGLFVSALGGSAGAADVVRAAVVLVLVFILLRRAIYLLTHPGASRWLASGLLMNAGLVFVAASWYQALRGDYWGLGLVPLCLLLAIPRPRSDPEARSRSLVPGAAMAVPSAAVIAVLATWNLLVEVLPDLAASHQRGQVVAAIADRMPADAELLLSSPLAARAELAGIRAEVGTAALVDAVQHGAPPPGTAGLVEQARSAPLFVSSLAFGLGAPWSTVLHTTPGEIWSSIRSCFHLSSVLRFTTSSGAETLFRLRVRGTPGEGC